MSQYLSTPRLHLTYIRPSLSSSLWWMFVEKDMGEKVEACCVRAKMAPVDYFPQSIGQSEEIGLHCLEPHLLKQTRHLGWVHTQHASLLSLWSITTTPHTHTPPAPISWSGAGGQGSLRTSTRLPLLLDLECSSLASTSEYLLFFFKFIFKFQIYLAFCVFQVLITQK